MFLHQEGTNDTGAYTTGAAGTTIGAINGLLALRQGGILCGTESGDAVETDTTVTALDLTALLLDVKVGKLATYRRQSIIYGIVWLLPGVLTMRTLFERVL